VIAFYILVFGLVYIKRDKFEIQAKIIALYRTQIGIPWINRMAEKYGRIIRGWAKLMIWPAWLFMILISGYLIYNSFALFAQPGAPGGVGIVLPGVKVPGSPIVLPLWHGILAIFIVATVHEAAHGLVAAAHKLKISATGIFVMGPIPGAFVEPDEKELLKAPKKIQTAIFAAGPMANMVLALLFFGGLFVMNGIWMESAQPYAIGMSFQAITEGLPAAEAGVPANIPFISANGQMLYTTNDFTDVMDTIMPGDELVLVSESGTEYRIIAGEHPDKGDAAGYIGIMGMKVHFRKWSGIDAAKLGFISWTHELFLWLVILSSGIGLVNLLPLGPADGGRMIQLVYRGWWGKKRGDDIWKKTSVAFLVILAVNVFVPMFRTLLNAAVSAVLSAVGMG